MDLSVKKVLTRRETVLQPQDGDRPLDKLCVAVLIDNPLAGQVAQDLSGLIQASKTLGEDIARILAQLGVDPSWESYGKGGIVGLDGEQEQINALLTTTFAEPFRAALGGAKAWIPSVTKRGAAGVSIDIPLAHKDALYVRSHYLRMPLHLLIPHLTRKAWMQRFGEESRTETTPGVGNPDKNA